MSARNEGCSNHPRTLHNMTLLYRFFGTVAELREQVIPAIEREDYPLWPESYEPYSAVFDR